jgi:hypothetical protein
VKFLTGFFAETPNLLLILDQMAGLDQISSALGYYHRVLHFRFVRRGYICHTTQPGPFKSNLILLGIAHFRGGDFVSIT